MGAEDEMEEGSLGVFTYLFGATELIGAVLLILIAVWMGKFRGGFAWSSNPTLEFNWHPLLMTAGMIFLYANAILVYRSCRNVRKKKLKYAHATITVTAFVLTIIGLVAVFDSHNLASPPISNLYSLHSWIGLGAVMLFVGQWICGFIAFLYPTASLTIRANYLPFHTLFGVKIFACSIVAALIGLAEKAIFSVQDYSEFSSEGILINCIGIFIFIFACMVTYMVIEPKYKRHPLPEDEMLLSSLTIKKMMKATMKFQFPKFRIFYVDLFGLLPVTIAKICKSQYSLQAAK